MKANTKVLSQSYVSSYRTQNRVKSEEFDARGRARIMFEKAVHKAETELMKHHYKSELESTDNNVKAEALAKVAFHRPGSFLTKEEIAHIQQETMAECPKVPELNCASNQMIRTIDGTCNNLDKPRLAAAGTNFRRIIPPHYEDGVQKPRGTLQRRNMGLLGEGPFDPPNPSAREASRNILQDRVIDDPNHSHMIMQWGQFLDHDLDLAPELREECPEDVCEVTEACSPIAIVQDPDGDPTFGSEECMFFPRSMPSCDVPRGEFPPRDQFNALTHYIDASNVYGSSDKVAMELREEKGGRLKDGPPHAKGAKPSLPLYPHEEAEGLTECPSPNEECYVAGDVRVNEHLSLNIMHTIWMREHNRIVAELARLDSTMTDEELYQTARKIIGGVMQKIVFEDYLPEVLGRDTVNRFIRARRYEYESAVDPRIPNAYATAAFRYGHSLIRPAFARLDPDNKPTAAGPLNLLDSFYNTSQYNASDGTDPILRGLLTENARRSDEFINPVLTNQLFRTPENIGRDLVALNINRGRDHGLAPYPVWREFCIRFFKDEFDIIVEPTFRSELTKLHLIRTYGSLDTVDLFPGGMAEAPFTFGRTSSIVGPTFTCIFIITYCGLSRGDRFYYLGDAAFTPAQRAEVQKASLSKVICDNSDGIRSLQPNAFRVPSTSNQPVKCSSLPAPNLAAFVSTASPGQCRRTTYMRLTGTSRVRVALAALIDRVNFNKIRDTRFFRLGSTGPACIRITCPKSFIRLLAVGFRCRAPVHAPGLPDSISKLPAYDAKIPENSLVAANGFYSSLTACQSGSVSALTITRRAASQETEMESQVTDDEEIFKQINETFYSGKYTESQETSGPIEINLEPSNNKKEDVEAAAKANADQDALLQSLEEALQGLE